MGLDITAHGKIKFIRKIEADEDMDNIYKNNLIRFWVNPHFDGRCDDIDKDGVYTSDENFGFRAGSYSGYNHWRNTLAKLGGYNSAEAVWAKETSGPFYEIINFSDCEGVIGTEVSKKLCEDFKSYKEKAENFTDDPWFYKSYLNWLKAFEMASNDGCVSFH